MSRAPRLLIAALAVGLTVPSFLLSAPTSVAAVGCHAANHVAGDLDSDGLADVVVGVPSYEGDRGPFNILSSNGNPRFVGATDRARTGVLGAVFGESPPLGDLNPEG